MTLTRLPAASFLFQMRVCCCRSARGASHLSVPLLLELCKEAASVGPADCIAGIPSAMSRSMSGDAQVELCRGEEGSDIVSCVQTLSTSKALSDTDRIALCKGGESSSPAQCFTSMPAWVSTAAKLELCRAATSTGPAECAKALSSGSASANSAAAEAVAAVCSGAQSEGPALCYNHVAKGSSSSKLSSAERADLCRGATSEAPAVCVAAVKDTRMSTADKAELCLGAADSSAAVCMNAVPARLSVAQKIQLCSSSADSSSRSSSSVEGPTAPVQCFNSAANSLSEQQRVELCAGAHSSGPAACIKAVGYSLDSRDERVALCSGASSAAPALCVRALKTRTDAATVLALCRGAVSAAPAHCFDAAPQQLALPLKLRLCAGATAASVADCMAAAQPRSRQAVSASMAQCPMTRSTGAVATAKRILSPEVAIELCRSSDEASIIAVSSSSSSDSSAAYSKTAASAEEDVTAPVVCAQMAPHGFEDSDLLRLCRRTTAAEAEAAATTTADDDDTDSSTTTAAAASTGGDSTPGGGAAAAQCASDAPHSFSPLHRAQLCRGANSIAPAVCAAVASAAQHSVSTALIVAACSGAASSNPAHCLAAAAAAGCSSSGVTLATAQECRAAQPEPASIAIKQLSFAGEVLYTNEPVKALLVVHDQWGRAMTWLTGTYVTASLAQQGSNGAVIGGPGRVNTTRSGLVEFAGLTFTQPGNLTLLFSVAGTRLAAVRVRVEETEEAAFVRHCGNVFARFRCFPGDSRYYTAGTASGSTTEVTASMPWPQGWTALTCADVMRDNGFKVAAGWKKEVWLWYHPGIEALETGHGLPLATMSAWERLDLTEGDSTVTASVIKRAYYRESLKWHPDRWVKYSMHAERAQAVFELISDAYKSLSSSSRAAAAAASSSGRSSEPVIVPVAV
jgi:DnaJ domain